MSAIRKATKLGGLAIISVRPIEFWDFNKKIPEQHRARLKAEHGRGYVAFYPAGGSEKELNYGDSSIPLDGFENRFPGWSVLRTGTFFVDPYQLFVVLSAS